MKRLIISGIPCTQQAWLKIFPAEENVEQKIISFIDVFDKFYYKNNKITDLVPFLFDVIQEFKPDQIILHDIGVTLGILALIKAKITNSASQQTVIIFNGAFNGFDVNKSTHPIRIQSMSYQDFEHEVQEQGGEIDPKYREHYPAIKLLYQQITEISKKKIADENENRLHHSFSKQENYPKINLGGKVFIIASQNDPYIHFECLEILEKTCVNSYLKVINYGHFPYSGDIKLLKTEIDRFHETTRTTQLDYEKKP